MALAIVNIYESIKKIEDFVNISGDCAEVLNKLYDEKELKTMIDVFTELNLNRNIVNTVDYAILKQKDKIYTLPCYFNELSNKKEIFDKYQPMSHLNHDSDISILLDYITLSTFEIKCEIVMKMFDLVCKNLSTINDRIKLILIDKYNEFIDRMPQLSKFNEEIEYIKSM